jgi:hypothetical protein
MQNFYFRLAPWLIAIIEFVLMSAAGVLILRARSSGRNHSKLFVLQSLKHAFHWLAARRRLAVLAVGVSVIVTRVALIPVLEIPQPRWHDEFSYLLAADTFAHGRLTNPTHPMWVHFESFHIIEHPTYMSMYPPAQGLVLAAGQLLGQAWIGQILVTAAMCSTLCWMLQGWLPPRWALFGAILAALRLGILSYWMNTYWCASVATLGGALALGAWPRLRKRVSAGESLILGLGLVILANSRPYEGFVYSIPIACVMLAWLVGRNHPPLRESLLRVFVPIGITLLLGSLATGFYYYRVTGSPFVMTYQVNRSQYATAPYFIWQRPQSEPVYHNAVMRDYYRGELEEFERNRTAVGYLERAGQKFASWWQFYLGPLLTLPLLAFPWVIRNRKMRLPLILCCAMIAGFAVQTWTLAHYFSPATGALYILLVQGLRYLRLWRRRVSAIGRAIVRAVPVLACAMILLRVTAAATHTQIEPQWPRGNLDRAKILTELRDLPGKQLVLVRYGNHHDKDREWVWNDASIDDAKVVWARDMGERDNQELLSYFKDRRVWCINGDDSQPRLEPFQDAALGN